MIRSIATVSIGGALDEKLRTIAAAGFRAVEIFENDFTCYDGSAREVASMCSDLGLKICALQPFRDFEGMPGNLRTQAFRRIEKKFDLMQELGTDLLLVCSNVSHASLGGIDRAADDFRELGERASARNLRVGFEALAWGRHVNDYRDAWEIVRRADHRSIGIILDSFHTLAPSFPVAAIRAIPGNRIFLVQLADAPQLDLDVLSWSRHFRCFPGQGSLAIREFMQAVDATGYKGPLSLEIFNDQFRAQSTKDFAVDGMRSLVLLDDDETRAQVAPALRTRSVVTEVVFIEFAIEPSHAAALATLFGELGFRLTGRHRSKAVERWSQGSVNLLINSSPDSFAKSHTVTHGSGVCAIGLEIADVPTMMNRAEAIQAAAFRQPVGPGELTIPAIRGVGGSLLYFLAPGSSNWNIDFLPIESNSDTGMLRRVDHISQSMRFEEMLSWEQFYTALFEVDRSPQLEIADPLGLVKSQVLQSKDGSLRLVLNASTASQTMSSRFLSEFFGAGVQHIAFTCDDIFKATSAMRAAGATFLKIPDNYYDDIDSRFDLDPALLKSMKENAILYDRDDVGDFFQIYTHAFEDRFFFEIVQRRGYKGFGAPNAGIRLAAQTREAKPRSMPRLS
ncbi:sugar phosphate isomerase/epimerase and 4-hydroxyphenylpyruvate domain-containing protein [Bradyrhizobium jicamae]|uniref:3-dehydroshikimate dehydratase n=1 Tax=Bradyrhizobium jicamae TaxID=280332 RepID=A0ABS5FWH2_9BRAD|nr:sugar phosphate isomerase/epimerase and 4-hydroxyphenylpyruvate domain-containing protein [Bradyrhizobium jicamae]MBR0801202.1 sugar phosphate isomerase/epimerase and 4-hydroxyphenylpyruvate domain-containing protein [Bradyrhizobium jicamae]MBR0938481.1 sugar phosphate isomerase/epimerase and 4-hydroxyphenylpyruvate domain-containing protein [Bradyrhizobium jicamae]